MRSGSGIDGRRSIFSARRQGRSVLCAGAFRHRRARLLLVMTLLAAVLVVLIAPSIDMPETVLREHHVAPHAMANNGSGTLAVTGLISVEQVFQDLTIQTLGSFWILDQMHSQTSVVLRC